jgi:hypothetical protein
MTLLIYSKNVNGAEKRLFRVIELLLPENKFEFYRSIDDFTLRLRQPVFNPRIAILLASSRDDLQNILSIRELLEDTKIILIVPDTNPATVAQGHTLRPRFLSDCNSDFIDVASVLGQMIRNLDHHDGAVH